MTRSTFLQKVKRLLPENPVCVEIGVYQGDFSEMILRDLQPSELYLLDPFEINLEIYPDNLSTAYSTENDYEIMTQRLKDYKNIFIRKQYSFEAVKTFYDEVLDFIYIDGCHLYECVKQDLSDWLPKLKSGGIMAGHDYIDLDGFGVKQAVNEFCKENNFEIIILNEDGGDFALRQK